MQQQYTIVCLCLLFISKYSVDSTTTSVPVPDWPGDPAICQIIPVSTPSPSTSSSSTSSPPPTIPTFSTQAEFSIEEITTRYDMGTQTAHELILSHYIYDYDNNRLTVVDNRNGNYDSRFYDYDQLRESFYYAHGTNCNATEIPQNDPTDGLSAIDLGNETWHIRRLNEFLLFSSDDPKRPVPIIYRGEGSIRNIAVDIWESCHVNPEFKRTEKVVWSFAKRGSNMPSGLVGSIGIPVQAVTNVSIVRDDNVQIHKENSVVNVLNFRPSLIKSFYEISPPKGIICEGVRQDQLVSLSDVGVQWPWRFGVRVEVSTSRSSQWQRIHLFYQRGENDLTSRLRYDYLPAGAEDFQSVIHDYTDNLTYIIDRRLGSCEIKRGVEYKDVDPFRDPIGFFLKHEDMFILNPPKDAWEVKGFRSCRTGSIECAIFATTKPNFPDIVEPDTGAPTGETWSFTNIEYTWSKRAPHASSESNQTQSYDYPVSLYLKLNRNNQYEDIEYEFYEMTNDSTINRFDVSTCYRSKEYDYLHLVFNLNVNRAEFIENHNLDRRRFERDLHYQLVNRMQIRYSRLTNLEVDHELSGNRVTVFFTLLGQTPKPESPSKFDDREPTATQAQTILKEVIDNGQFVFQVILLDGSHAEFRAVPDSLEASKQFKSSHTSAQNIRNYSYSAGSQALAICVGTLVGLLGGVLFAAILRLVRKDPMPSLPTSIPSPMATINFRATKNTDATDA